MNILTKLIDIIYPPRCPVCQSFLGKDRQRGANKAISLCRDCLGDFRKISPPLCPICCTPFASGVEENHICEDCLRKRPFYRATGAPYLYEGPLLTAIHNFKYGGKSSLADSLGPLLAQFAGTWVVESDDLLTIPVPLHPKKLRERGFNQSLLLARHVARRLHTDLDFLSLRRERYTIPQTGLGKEDRRKNVRGAFRVKGPEALKGKRVLLVDDVATTGNTLNECALVLRRSGCKEVLCLVLARTGTLGFNVL